MSNPEATPPGPAPDFASVAHYPKQNPFLRLFALWYFCTLMTLWNILGRTVLGFEQSWLQYCTAVGTAIGMQFLLEWVDARARGRRVRFGGSLGNFINFLPPPIIAGSACSMLLFPNVRCWPFAFAAALSIGSKLMFRIPMGGGVTQHAFNPSNLGIMATVFLFPWVGIAPPYHFTNRVDIGDGTWNLIVPAVALLSGIFLHWKFTARLPLIASWIFGFVGQALVRSYLAGVPVHIMLVPMTGASFVVFTLYMIPDPATTPLDPTAQVMFGTSIAVIYGVLFLFHVVYGLFLSLLIVSGVRYVYLNFRDWFERNDPRSGGVHATLH